ncbi:MAG: hypothetical protein R3268_03905 [Acidiferrobacterales bacterium]|nr:hypothetical protein [Acidiferrobacterales bacterium]
MLSAGNLQRTPMDKRLACKPIARPPAFGIPLHPIGNKSPMDMNKTYADPVTYAIALGEAMDWVCRYARELGGQERQASVAHDIIASFVARHGTDQLQRLQELVAQARFYAPHMVVEGTQIFERLRELAKGLSSA